MAASVFSNGASSKLNSARIFAQPMDKKIYLKPRKEESLLRQHPWVFSGAIKRMEGQPVTGDLVEVCANKGRTLGFGHYSAHTSIAVRMLSFDAEFDADSWWHARIANAVEVRRNLGLMKATTQFVD